MQTLGKYQLVRKLAAGGMAEVFLARADGPKGFHKTLVLKQVLPHLARDPVFTEMFLAEAKIAARLDHPNVVQTFDFGEVNGTYYLAMEYIDGPDLRTLNQIAWQRWEPPPFAIAAKIIALACEGLAYAHAFRDPSTGKITEFIHRDISPDNLIIARSGAVKIVDFGISKAIAGANGTQSGLLKGKFAYMSPEQLAQRTLDRRVDVFALGMVLYELLTGALPFDEVSEALRIQAMLQPEPIPPIRTKRPDVPIALQRIVERALAKKPAGRYPDCRSMQHDLERYLTSAGQMVPGHVLAEWVQAVSPPEEEAPEPLTPEEMENSLADTQVRQSNAQTREALAALVKTPTGRTARWESQAEEGVSSLPRVLFSSRASTPARKGASKFAGGFAVAALLMAVAAGGVWWMKGTRTARFDAAANAPTAQVESVPVEIADKTAEPAPSAETVPAEAATAEAAPAAPVADVVAANDGTGDETEPADAAKAPAARPTRSTRRSRKTNRSFLNAVANVREGAGQNPEPEAAVAPAATPAAPAAAVPTTPAPPAGTTAAATTAVAASPERAEADEAPTAEKDGVEASESVSTEP